MDRTTVLNYSQDGLWLRCSITVDRPIKSKGQDRVRFVAREWTPREFIDVGLHLPGARLSVSNTKVPALLGSEAGRCGVPTKLVRYKKQVLSLVVKAVVGSAIPRVTAR
jgi:hypothetical protein